MAEHQSGGVMLTEAELEGAYTQTSFTGRVTHLFDVEQVERVVTARLAAQAGRVAKVVEKIHLAHELVDGGVIPLYQCAAQGCEWTCDRIEFSPTEAVQLHAAHLGAVVLVELEADQ